MLEILDINARIIFYKIFLTLELSRLMVGIQNFLFTGRITTDSPNLQLNISMTKAFSVHIFHKRTENKKCDKSITTDGTL